MAAEQPPRLPCRHRGKGGTGHGRHTGVAETAPHTRFPLLPVLVRLLADFARPSPLLAALVVALTVVGGLLPAAGIWASRGLIDAALALIRPAGTPSPARALAWAAAVLATGLLGPAAANLSITAGDVLRARQRGNLMAAVLRRAATDPRAQTESGAYQDAPNGRATARTSRPPTPS